MKCAMLFTSSGPILIVTSSESMDDSRFLERVAEKGIDKFIGFELPERIVKQRYGNHYNVVCENLHETDELRVLDYDGNRIMELFDFSEFGPPIFVKIPEKMLIR